MKKLIPLILLQMTFLASAGADERNWNFSSMEEVMREALVDTNSSASCRISAENKSMSHILFQAARYKLLNVNKWAKRIGIPGQEFQLYSGKEEVNRLAQEGDLIRIKLPMDPTLRSYWVKIESVEGQSENLEGQIKIIVRPTTNPFKNRIEKNITDHFFTNKATNTFSVSLKNGKIKSSVSGKNEEANQTQVESHIDAAANYTISQMGWGININESRLGFQSMVWAQLNKELAQCEL